MSTFKTLDTFFKPTLDLPVTAGKVYKIQPVDAATGVEITAMMGVATRAYLNKSEPTPDELAEVIGSNEGQESLYKRVLGDVYDELVADGHNFEVIKFVGTTATIWITTGIEAAEEFWNNGGQPPKARKTPADRKRSAK